MFVPNSFFHCVLSTYRKFSSLQLFSSKHFLKYNCQNPYTFQSCIQQSYLHVVSETQYTTFCLCHKVIYLIQHGRSCMYVYYVHIYINTNVQYLGFLKKRESSHCFYKKDKYTEYPHDKAC